MTTIVLCTGGFDPPHSGHIAYFEAAASLGDYLIVGINSDEWLVRKKGQAFMPFRERSRIINAFQVVTGSFPFNDDSGDACDAIEKVLIANPEATILFANGGDRTETETPEYTRYKNHPQVKFIFGVGGNNKENSSSWMLEDWKAPRTIRSWGWYTVLRDATGVKVKELIINPKSELSMRRHCHRNEIWLIGEGSCVVKTIHKNDCFPEEVKLNTHSHYTVEKEFWHQLCNPYDVPCKIFEFQYGEQCIEEDIERRE